MAELKGVFDFGGPGSVSQQGGWKLANTVKAERPVITLTLPCVAFIPQNRQDKEKTGPSKTFPFFLLVVLLLSAPRSP